MNPGNITRIFGVAAVLACAGLSPVIDSPSAAADQCPGSEVVFARGTGEPPGVGGVGQAFIDALQSQLPGQSVDVYPVNYPATDDYRNSSAVGADDATAHVTSMVANCPNTRIVLGGYSQGAAVTDSVTDSLSPQTANHVAAVALFGNPTSSYAASLFGAPLPTLNPAYRPKTIDLCTPDDIICAEGGNMVAHLMYVPAMSDEAATFVANRLKPSAATQRS